MIQYGTVKKILHASSTPWMRWQQALIRQGIVHGTLLVLRLCNTAAFHILTHDSCQLKMYCTQSVLFNIPTWRGLLRAAFAGVCLELACEGEGNESVPYCREDPTCILQRAAAECNVI